MYWINMTAAIVAGWLVLRLLTMTLSAIKFLFCSPKQGQIMGRVRNGKVISFLPHLKGLSGQLPDSTKPSGYHVGAVHMNERTGQVEKGPENIRSLWWWLFGVRWIGLDSIYSYPITKKTVQPDGSIKTETVTASSLHFSDIYTFVYKGGENKDGTSGDLTYTLTLQTVNARETLKIRGWLQVVEASAQGTTKDYISSYTTRELLEKKTELSTEPDSFVNEMKKLNNDTVGNVSLPRRIGQLIIAANVTQVAFKDQVTNALQSARIAEETGKGTIAKAKSEADAAEHTARGRLAIGRADNTIIQERAEILKGRGGALTARVEEKRLLADALGKLTGLRVIGGSGTLINLDETGKDKA